MAAAPKIISPSGPEGAGARLANGPEASARGSLGVARPPSTEIGRRQSPDVLQRLSLSPAGNEATAHLEGLKAVRGTEKASSPDGAAPEVQAPSGEQGGSSAVEDTAIAAVTKELDGQKPKTEVKSSDPDIVVPTDVLRRDPDFDKKVAAAIAVAATAGKKITENQAKTALLNEHYQAWAKDQSNIPNFLRLVLTERSFRQTLRKKMKAVSAARQMGETVTDSSVELALAEWRKNKDIAADELRKKGETGLINKLFKLFNKIVKVALLFTMKTAEQDIVPGLKEKPQH